MYMSKIKNLAFTLAELLTAVLVISVIMVALAPVITKRMKENITVQTDNKKGLEIYTNPGTYTFDVPIGINTLFIQGSGGGGGGGGSSYIDKEISFNTIGTQTWIVPRGVNQITFTITGSGGGGGGGYAQKINKNCVAGMTQIQFISDNGLDLCVTDSQTPVNGAYNGLIRTVSAKTTCDRDMCCWQNSESYCNSAGGYSGCNKTTCTYGAAQSWCSSSQFAAKYSVSNARLIKLSEIKRIISYGKLGKNGLKVCKNISISDSYCPSGTINKYDNYVSRCEMGVENSAPGSNNSYAYTAHIWLDNEEQLCFYKNTISYNKNPLQDKKIPYSVFCAYELDNWFQYSGAGGASGAVMEKTINVLPNDTFEITIGSGGSGGAARTKGSQGGTTKIVHKRGGVELGTYYVKGGLGGNGASTTANGAAYTNGTASGNTTVSGTCYARNRKDTSDSFVGGNTTCSVISYSGESGTELQGGNGGRLKNEGVATQGGTIGEMGENVSSGKNATEYAFGGGGGTCKRGVRTASSCSSGGKGANGKINISYRIMLPGGGGGAATRVGGSKVVSEKNTDYEIKYKIQEGTRLVFQIGAGGTGGLAGQNGTNGQPTTISGNKIIFLGGEGGKTVTSAQKNNLSSCIGTTTNSTTIKNCINNSSYKAQGGKSSYVSTDSALVNNSTGLITNDSGKISYTISTSFKGNNGKTGAQSYNIIPYTYGFDGGTGGAPFGIRSNSIVASISCGGGISGTYGSTTDANAYLCTSGSPDGNSARSHDPVNNEFGGSGGGGAGAVGDSFEQGSGGNGSSGYLRIRWDASEQE